MYRQIFNCEFNIQFFKTKKMGISQKLTEEGKRGKKSKFSSISKKNKISREICSNKLTVDDLHQMACFDLQAALPTATGDISNCSLKQTIYSQILLFVTFRCKQ